MGEIIVITSGKGGVGKTTTTANIGVGLAMEGKEVALVDTDIGLRNLDVVMGLENRIVFDLVDVAEKQCKLQQALIKDRRHKNLWLLPAAQTRDKNSVSSEQMQDVCQELKEKFEYVIIDCPAGIEQGFINATIGADSAIIVTTPEVSAVRDADRIIGLLESQEFENHKLIINRLDPEMVNRGDMLAIKDVLEILTVELLGVVPSDNNIIVSTNRGEPVVGTDSLAGKAFRNVTRRILGDNVPLLDLNGKNSFFDKIKKMVKLG